MGGISSRALYPSEGSCNITEGNNGSLVNTGKAVFSSNETTKLEEDEYGISATEPRETSKDRELFKDNLGGTYIHHFFLQIGGGYNTLLILTFI